MEKVLCHNRQKDKLHRTVWHGSLRNTHMHTESVHMQDSQMHLSSRFVRFTAAGLIIKTKIGSQKDSEKIGVNLILYFFIKQDNLFQSHAER